MRTVQALLDLVTVLLDTLIHGDLGGHLAAWWSVVTGDVTPNTRFTLLEARNVEL